MMVSVYGQMCVTLPEGVSGTIYSPGFNGVDKYPDGVDCEWNITVSEDRSVLLQFTSFDIEYHDRCKYDYVKVSVYTPFY